MEQNPIYEWNKAEEWVVHRRHTSRAQLFALLTKDVPLSKQFRDLRSCFEPFRFLSPREMRERVGPEGNVDLGKMATREAIRLMQRLAQCGMACRQEDRSFVSYLPVNKTRNLAWIIEDNQQAEEISQQMISAGVPVVDAQDD